MPPIRMKIPRRIFYSWQSDTPNSIGRSLIQNCLERAVRGIGEDRPAEIEVVLDRDTSGISGSPDITDTILAKIALCDVLVADVTIISSHDRRHFPRFLGWARSGGAKQTPNPNVLVELGYAITHLGWGRIILIQNLAFGSPEELPFDLRGRRVLTFRSYSGGGDLTRAARKELTSKIETSLRSALGLLDRTWGAPERWEPRWWGYWTQEKLGSMSSGTLFIREVGSRGFFFHITVANGAHTGGVDGSAEFAGPYAAQAWIPIGKGETFCCLQFRQNPESPGFLSVTESAECRSFHGLGASFRGTFHRSNERLYDLGYFSELELQRLYGITGQFFRPMMQRFDYITPTEVRDTFMAQAFTGFVRGTGNWMRAIVMKGRYGELWAAYTDGSLVRYFTTELESKTMLPLTIAMWRDAAPEQEVVYDSGVRVTPVHL